ncbi:MAG: mannose-6-phosphate isomerase [Planctomycetaceae bacterium]|jgi:mannose-6-phosphate isomerase|nr:mannose-6-phosphate isomerase [Planctomycetaceae bacterium]MBP62848.1 mannose-6-phosphate isomerase [Planctomycetaceae bacterium]
MLYPLIFQPVFRRYLWGGRRLESVLGKKIGEGNDYAESWEIVDRGADQSVVLHGKLAGSTLNDLVTEYAVELFGKQHPWKQFPLLFKFLDANRSLSVQVHPDDAQAARLDPPDLGKTEAWFVLESQPGSNVYAGLRPGVDREMLARKIANGETESCLHQFQPRVGDCIFIPAGTVHALGEGLLVAEIQQASDTTFRLYDWDRRDADGRSRQLHIQESLEIADYESGPVGPQTPLPTDNAARVRLVTCDKFVLERWSLSESGTIPAVDSCHLLAILSGSLEIEHDSVPTPLGAGQTMVIPASCVGTRFTPLQPTVLLDIWLP